MNMTIPEELINLFQKCKDFVLNYGCKITKTDENINKLIEIFKEVNT